VWGPFVDAAFVYRFMLIDETQWTMLRRDASAKEKAFPNLGVKLVLDLNPEHVYCHEEQDIVYTAFLYVSKTTNMATLWSLLRCRLDWDIVQLQGVHQRIRIRTIRGALVERGASLLSSTGQGVKEFRPCQGGISQILVCDSAMEDGSIRELCHFVEPCDGELSDSPHKLHVFIERFAQLEFWEPEVRRISLDWKRIKGLTPFVQSYQYGHPAIPIFA
jgi:hypothetical protein